MNFYYSLEVTKITIMHRYQQNVHFKKKKSAKIISVLNMEIKYHIPVHSSSKLNRTILKNLTLGFSYFLMKTQKIRVTFQIMFLNSFLGK